MKPFPLENNNIILIVLLTKWHRKLKNAIQKIIQEISILNNS